ncbi:heme ABC transporter ATP-binding protein [Microvirga pudoricolor]|uniref:heme ABC transporter ATP-binding protein n=1 Tax=Microvirga pudoricolor TaxID=2778729 RepID=UPI0019506C47|nr:heme ABC transporter ATP-binding protein [Microvirga pudoricolor]MBM6596248.1 heme ABC transporter ATP-binding protein [Microvirga pudoricolor]
MMPALEARDLTYELGGRALVDGIDLAIGKGRFTVIVGPNGAGKSTLLRLLCGELAPTRGEVAVGGQSLRRIGAWRLAHMRAVMPQAAELNFPFLVSEVVSLGVDGIGRGLTRADRAGLVRQALDRADVAHLAARYYQTLSGGERQRVHFARVVAQLAAGRSVESQQILFLDEPIASLDLRHQLAVIEEAKALAGAGVTVVAVLHDLLLAASASDDLVLLRAGRLVARGPAEDVLTHARLAEVFGVALTSPVLPTQPWAAIPAAGGSAQRL